jgi:hypothetical protein
MIRIHQISKVNILTKPQKNHLGSQKKAGIDGINQYIQKVTNDVIKNLKRDFKINITKQENKAIATYNVSIV